MSKHFTFRPVYFFIALLLFVVEVLIALYVRDAFIRPYGGDFLVVIFLYCLVKAFWKQSNKVIALSVLAFSFLIEILQYLDLLGLLGLQDNQLARVVLGSKFSWEDLLAYALGVLTVYLLDQRFGKDKLA